MWFVKRGKLLVVKRIEVTDNNYWPNKETPGKTWDRQTYKKKYTKNLFEITEGQYFGLNEIKSNSPMNSDVIALIEGTVLLTINKPDVLKQFSPEEIEMITNVTEHNVRFPEDIEIMNEV